MSDATPKTKTSSVPTLQILPNYAIAIDWIRHGISLASAAKDKAHVRHLKNALDQFMRWQDAHPDDVE